MKAWMLAGHMLLIPLSGWSQTPPPAEVIFLTAAPSPLRPSKDATPASQPDTAQTAAVATNGKKQIQVYKSVQQNGVVRYSDMAPEQGHYELLLFNDCFACDPKSSVNWQTTGLFLYDYASTIKAAAKTYQVEPALIRALIHAESAFNPLAVSRKG
ncbi:MAG: transglycosylase SLT domain-containing protein, partial [Aeromonas veronii]